MVLINIQLTWLDNSKVTDLKHRRYEGKQKPKLNQVKLHFRPLLVVSEHVLAARRNKSIRSAISSHQQNQMKGYAASCSPMAVTHTMFFVGKYLD